jgi:hypothetical protein
LDASNTPESPATDSSLTAADTDLVFVPDEDGVDKAATYNNYYLYTPVTISALTRLTF